jgi:hypothetical protein
MSAFVGLAILDLILVQAQLAVSLRLEWIQSHNSGHGKELVNFLLLGLAVVAEFFVLSAFGSTGAAVDLQVIVGYAVVIYLLEILSFRKAYIVQKNMLESKQIEEGKWKTTLIFALVLLLIAQLIADTIIGFIGLVIAFATFLSFVYLLKRANGPLVLTRMFWGTIGSCIVEGCVVFWRIFIVNADGNNNNLTVAQVTPFLYFAMIVHKLLVATSVGYTMWDLFFYKRYEILDDRVSMAGLGTDQGFEYTQSQA